MAITQFGATTTDFDNAMPTSLTTSRIQAAGTDTLLVVSVATEDDPTHDSVTFDGVSMTKEVEQLNGSSRRVSMWTLVAPNVTTANIVVTLGSAGDIGMIATSWENVDQVTPVNASAGNSGSSTTPSVVVNSASGERVIDAFGHDTAGNNPIVGAGQSELADVEVVGDFRTASSHQDGAAPNVTMDWSGMGNAVWASVGISLREASAGPGELRTHQMML